MNPMRGSDESSLDALFRAYEAACPVPEPGPNFMPDLWRRIESRQSFAFAFRRTASALVTAAVAVALCLGVYMSIARSTQPAFYAQSYVEVLAEADSVETPDIVAPVALDLSEPAR